ALRVKGGVAREHDGEAIGRGAGRGGPGLAAKRRARRGERQARVGSGQHGDRRGKETTLHPAAHKSPLNFEPSSKPRLWSRARWTIARSARAVMVRSGLTPIERGITAPSQT